MAAPVEPAAADLEALANPAPPTALVPAVVDPVLPALPAPPSTLDPFLFISRLLHLFFILCFCSLAFPSAVLAVTN